MNLKVFPATLNHEGQKVPLLKGWREKASNDPNQIRQWQEFFKDKLKFFGVPTGSINGIMALDIDIKKGNGFETLKNNNLEVPHTWWQKTISGGCHFLFQHDPSREVGNKVGFLPSLDTRSEGGWIALYGIDTSYPLSPMPQWLYEACKKKEKETTSDSVLVKISPFVS